MSANSFQLLTVIFSLVISIGSFAAPKIEKMIRVGSGVDFAPYSFVDDKGDVQGLAPDLLRATTREQDVTLSYRVGPWSETLRELQEGKIDVIPFIAISDRRRQAIDFTVPYLTRWDAVFIKEGSQEINSIEDLRGKKVIVIENDIADEYLSEKFPSVQKQKVGSFEAGLKLLSSGWGDALVGGQVNIHLLIKKLKYRNIRQTTMIHDYRREYAFGVKKGNSDLLGILNQGLDSARIRGDLNRIEKIWTDEITPTSEKERKIRGLLRKLMLAIACLSFIALVWVWALKREVRRSRKQLLDSEARLSKISQRLPAMVYSFSLEPDGKMSFLDVSEAGMRIFEKQQNVLLSSFESVMKEVLHPDDFPDLVEKIYGSAEKLTTFRWTGRLKFSDDRIKWIQAISEPHRDEKGTTLWNGILIDITEQKLLENELAVAQAKLAYSAKLSSLGEMAAGIGHEINNPLAIIVGKVEYLKKMAHQGNIPTAELLEHLDKLEKTTGRIYKIIKGLRSFSRDGSRDDFAIASVKQIIDETLDLCREKFAHHGVKLTVLPFEDFFISCRPVQISQVLVNLLNNAFDAVKSLDTKWIEIHATASNTWGKIIIRDSGTIPREVREKIMSPFFTTKPPGQGTGLGLSIARSIVNDHGGILLLDSDTQNTQFSLEIPAYRNSGTKAA